MCNPALRLGAQLPLQHHFLPDLHRRQATHLPESHAQPSLLRASQNKSPLTQMDVGQNKITGESAGAGLVYTKVGTEAATHQVCPWRRFGERRPHHVRGGRRALLTAAAIVAARGRITVRTLESLIIGDKYAERFSTFCT